MLVIDSYFLVDEETVDFFNSLVDSNLENSKILVSMREDTPYYNRFYDYLSVDKKVLELKIKGLDKEHTAEFLGKKMDEKLDQIYKVESLYFEAIKRKKRKKIKGKYKLYTRANQTITVFKLLIVSNSRAFLII